MSILSWINTRIKQRFYLKQDFRVMLNSLRMWNKASKAWEPVLSGLPNSYGRMSVTMVYMTGCNDLMFALLFRSNPMDLFSTPTVHPIMVYYTHDKGFWRKDFNSLEDMKSGIGTLNYDFLMSKAAIDWNRVQLV